MTCFVIPTVIYLRSLGLNSTSPIDRSSVQHVGSQQREIQLKDSVWCLRGTFVEATEAVVVKEMWVGLQLEWRERPGAQIK